MSHLSNREIIIIFFTTILEVLLLAGAVAFNYYLSQTFFASISDYTSNVTGLPMSYNFVITLSLIEIYIYITIKNKIKDKLSA